MLKKKNILDVADAIATARFKDLGWDPSCFYWGPDNGGSFLYPDQSGRGCLKVADVAGWAISVEQGRSIDITVLEGGYLILHKLKRRVQQFLGIDPMQYEQLVNFRGHPLLSDKNHPFMAQRGDTEWIKEITMKETATVLRVLADTGEVRWK